MGQGKGGREEGKSGRERQERGTREQGNRVVIRWPVDQSEDVREKKIKIRVDAHSVCVIQSPLSKQSTSLDTNRHASLDYAGMLQRLW